MALLENISAVGVGQTYTSTASWEVAKRSDLTAKAHVGYDGYVEVAEIYGGGALTSYVPLTTGWTTDATHYIHMRAASGQGHEGIFNTNKAYLVGGDFGVVDVGVEYVKVGPGLCLRGKIPIQVYTNGANLVLDSCIIQCLYYSNSYGIIDLRASTIGTHMVKNCVLEKTNNANYCPAIASVTSSSQTYVYNCTIVNSLHASDSGIDVSTGATVTSQNNYFHAPSGRTYVGVGTINKGSTDATSNADAVTAGLRSIAYSTANFTNVTLNSEDLHLAGASALKMKGTDLSSLGVTTDYEGGARRSGYLWDIGADQQSDVPLCWNYTAQYKNSNKLFKASGCGNFPKNLKVPNNVDTSSGKMVDDGLLIDPSQYNIE